MNKAPSQTDMIYAHLMAGHSLTPVEALDRFGSFRLSERIREIERKGVEVKRNWYTTEEGARVRRYWVDAPNYMRDDRE